MTAGSSPGEANYSKGLTLIDSDSIPVRRRLIPGAWAAVLALLAASPSLAEGPRGAGWISGDAVAYVEVARPSAILDRLTGEPVRGLLHSSPDFQKYLADDGYRQGRAAVDAVAGALGTTWDKALIDLVGGGLMLAVEPSTPPRAFLIATPRDPAFLVKTLDKILELARADAAGKGQPDPVKSAEHRGIKGYGLGPKAALAIVDGLLVFADSGDSLKAIIDRSIDRPDPATMLPGDPLWQARRKAQLSGDEAAWGLVRIDRLRQIQPKALAIPAQANPLLTLLFADWIEAARKAPWASASLTWTPRHLGASLTLATPPGGYSDVFKRYLPARGKGAPSLALPRGVIASLGLWRDLASLWEVRSDLFPPEVVQGFAQLDTVAGTYFGGRDFGTGVLGALGTDWRLVVARQDASTLDPVPDDKLPAFALIADLKPDDEDFAVRLKSAFQTFIGLANVGAAQNKAPPLMLGSETLDGVAISTARFLKPKAGPTPGEPVPSRHNFSPSIAQVGDHFILSSSASLVRDLIPALKNPAGPSDASLVIAAEGAELAALIEENRTRLVMQNMLEKGNDKPKAEDEVGVLARIVRALGRGSLSALDSPESVQFRVDFATPGR
jgi:hypothetical protein